MVVCSLHTYYLILDEGVFVAQFPRTFGWGWVAVITAIETPSAIRKAGIREAVNDYTSPAIVPPIPQAIVTMSLYPFYLLTPAYFIYF